MEPGQVGVATNGVARVSRKAGRAPQTTSFAQMLDDGFDLLGCKSALKENRAPPLAETLPAMRTPVDDDILLSCALIEPELPAFGLRFAVVGTVSIRTADFFEIMNCGWLLNNHDPGVTEMRNDVQII